MQKNTISALMCLLIFLAFSFPQIQMAQAKVVEKPLRRDAWDIQLSLSNDEAKAGDTLTLSVNITILQDIDEIAIEVSPSSPLTASPSEWSDKDLKKNEKRNPEISIKVPGILSLRWVSKGDVYDVVVNATSTSDGIICMDDERFWIKITEAPGIPGFPLEGVALGIILAIAVVISQHRPRMQQRLLHT